MFGLSYHCGNCDGVTPELNHGKCTTCGSTSVVPAGWYQLSVEERTEWLERIRGGRAESDPWRLDEPGIRPRVELPPLQSCTASTARWAVMFPPRPIAGPSLLTQLWVTFCAYLASLFEAAPEPVDRRAPEPLVLQMEAPAPLTRMTKTQRPRVRPSRPVVWSRAHAPRARVSVDRTRMLRAQITKSGPGPPRRKRLRLG